MNEFRKKTLQVWFFFFFFLLHGNIWDFYISFIFWEMKFVDRKKNVNFSKMQSWKKEQGHFSILIDNSRIILEFFLQMESLMNYFVPIFEFNWELEKKKLRKISLTLKMNVLTNISSILFSCFVCLSCRKWRVKWMSIMKNLFSLSHVTKYYPINCSVSACVLMSI